MDKRQDSSSIRTLVLYLFLIPIYESLRRFTGTSPLEYNKSEFDLHVNLFSKWASVVLRRRLCNQRALRNRNRNAATRLPGSYCTVAVVSSPFEILFWFCIFWTSPSRVNSSFSFRDSGKCPEFRPNPKAKKFSRTRTRNPEFGIFRVRKKIRDTSGLNGCFWISFSLWERRWSSFFSALVRCWDNAEESID